MDSLCTANTTFALDLLRKLCKNKSGQNLFFSPFGISSALSMILLGSKGNTEAQIAKVCLNKLSVLNLGPYEQQICIMSVTCTFMLNYCHSGLREQRFSFGMYVSGTCFYRGSFLRYEIKRFLGFVLCFFVFLFF